MKNINTVNTGDSSAMRSVARKGASVWDTVSRLAGRALCLVAGLVLLGMVGSGHAFAQTDIASTITTLTSYWNAALAIGVVVLLWVVGRMLVHKGTRG